MLGQFQMKILSNEALGVVLYGATSVFLSLLLGGNGLLNLIFRRKLILSYGLCKNQMN